MAEGKIQKLTGHSFGFIETASGREIFFHANRLQGANSEKPQNGQRVSFAQTCSEKGPQADNMTVT